MTAHSLAYRVFLAGLSVFTSAFLSVSLFADDEGLSPAVFFAAWDPWLQTGCRAADGLREDTGYRVQYDPRFRVVRATRIENGVSKDVWSYSWNEQGILQRAWRRLGPMILESAEYDQDGRFVRLHKHHGMNEPQASEEYVYGRDGRLMVIKMYKGKDLEMVTEVRYHPSGSVFMHVITNGGNAVIGRVLFDTDSHGRVLVERHFLWGWLVKTVKRSWCPHGVLLAVEEQAASLTERVRDPFFVEHKPSAP